MVSAAREEAGRRLDAARTRAQKYYTEAYDAAMAAAISGREAAEKAALEEYNGAIRDFRSRLEASSLDRGAFAAACRHALDEGG